MTGEKGGVIGWETKNNKEKEKYGIFETEKFQCYEKLTLITALQLTLKY